MSRWFRLYAKKRGDRRTGSKALASAGEALFFASVFAIGALVLFLLLKRLVIPEWRANHSFEPTTCTVLRTDPLERPGENGPAYIPQIRIQYEVAGQKYEQSTFDIATVNDLRLVRRDEAAVQEAMSPFERGQQYTCWYDPADPRIVVLVRGYTWWLWLLLLLPVAFIGIGGGGVIYTLVHWGKSDEHRAATLLRAPNLKSGEPTDGAKEFPFVPKAANLTNSPGTTLAYRLPIHTSQGWRLFGAATLCVIWNGIVAVFVIMAGRQYLRGSTDLLLTLFTVPFVMGGVGLLYYLIRELVATTGIGPTQVEVSDHPLLPGGRYELLVSQAGRLNIRFLEVLLVCEEEANFHQGTDIRTERRKVYERQLFQKKKFEIQPGSPFQERFHFDIPTDAMHSFQAPHNEIKWKLTVKGEVDGRPPFERTFPVIIHPEIPASGVP